MMLTRLLCLLLSLALDVLSRSALEGGRMLRLLLLLLFSALCLPSPALAATYYVGVTGNDVNPGTSGSRFRNPQACANVMVGGDTCIVGDGTYTDHNADEAVVWQQTSGSAGNWITYRAENPRGATLSGTSFATDECFSLGVVGNSTTGRFIRLEGFKITECMNGIVGNDTGDDLEIVGNEIYNIGRVCSFSDFGFNGMYLAGQANILIERNLIHDIGRFSPGENGCDWTGAPPGSELNYQNHDHGIYGDNWSNVTIKNNIFYATQRGWAAQWVGTTSNIKVLNNTFSGANPWKPGQVLPCCGTHTTVEISNNIFHTPGGGDGIGQAGAVFYSSGGNTTWTVRNNLTQGGISHDVISSGTPSTVSGNLDNTAAGLTNPASNDYTLQSTSAAKDAALNLSGLGVTDDYLGVSRPQGSAFDIGAYELVPSGGGGGQPENPALDTPRRGKMWWR